ncbi:dihydroxyacetone kinase subunit DhaL [Ancrocorticia populi]|uniref:dihydroxyacetone kinase subunit DhaL n=1 Tax=Ancrocorticia populi TaxID=2175228 RepID=UPI0023558EEF|nr:dihydroxyacetone kinase subunit DhaL [Ancrocorticia populi]
MTEPLTTEQVRGVLAAACQAIYDAREALSDADRQIGDGDHGVGMGRGFKAAREAVETADLSTVGDAFKAVGSAVMRTSGGASGAVFGTMFRGPAKILKADTLDGEGLAQALEESAEQVQLRGKAKPGDKTMLDALVPAGLAARESADAGGDVLAVAKAAASAAHDGCEATIDMKATVGKSKSLGERSLGYRDPGAISVTILLDTIAEAIEAA